MTLGEIAAVVGGELYGPADLRIDGPDSIESNRSGSIVFAVSPAYLAKAENSNASAVLLPQGLSSEKKPYICVADPKVAFGKLLHSATRPLPLAPGIHSTAVVDPAATVSSRAQIGPYAVIERGAKIGAGARIYPFAYIGEDCTLGENCVVYPHAVLYQSVTIGDNTIVHAGAVLGADGFGFVWDGTQHVKVPHVGGVAVEGNCEVGALTAIDRAMVGSTNIGAGTKIDNLVQVGHNTSIGANTVIAAQAGISGTVEIGERVVIAGQAGVADHVRITSDVVLAARTAALQDIDQPGEYIGTPAQPSALGKKSMLLIGKLPEMLSRIRKLEKRVDE